MLFRKPQSKKLLLAEISLILATVFIFRSLWLLMDTVPVLGETGALVLMLVLGVVACIPALRYLIKK